MIKMDHQHRLRVLNQQIPRVLVNLCFQQDLIRKPLRGTYSSKEITIFHRINSVGRLEDSRRRITEVEPEPLQGGAAQSHMQAARPMGPTWQPLVAISVLHCLKDCISVVYLSRFDPKAQDWCSGLYIPACTPLQGIHAFDPDSLRAKTLIHISTRIRASNQEKISSQ